MIKTLLKRYIVPSILAILGVFLLANAQTRVGVREGGTGSTSTVSAGQFLIGNTNGTFSVTDITAGGNIALTTSSGGLTVALSNPGFVTAASSVTWTSVQTLTTTTRPQSDIVYSTSSIGPVLRSPDGTCFRFSVSNLGVLSVDSLTCP